ncbi:hypothetical protein [Ekhidna sp.]
MLKELHTLFEHVPPYQLRQTVEDLFFQYQSEHPVPLTLDQIEDIHLLVKFLNQVELYVKQ